MNQQPKRPDAPGRAVERPKRPRPAPPPTGAEAKPPNPRRRDTVTSPSDGMTEKSRSPRPRQNIGKSDLSNNLRSQTPLNRRMEQKKAAPAEPGTRRRTSNRQYYRIKDDSDAPKHRIFRRILLVVACYAMIMTVCLAAISLYLPHHSTRETGNYVYQLGPDDGYYSRHTYSWDVVRNGDVFYLNMTEIATYCNMTTTGDDHVMRYIVKDTGETVEFVIGESIAMVNGVKERVGGNTYLRNGKVYVPMEFVNRCINGIRASVDTDTNKITVLRETTDSGDPAPISFPYKPSTTTSAIRFADLDHDLQLQILIQNQPKDPTENEGGSEAEPNPSAPAEP